MRIFFRIISTVFIITMLFMRLSCPSTKSVGGVDSGSGKTVGGVEKDDIRGSDYDPVPGNSGALNVDGLSNSQVKVNWSPATDEETPANELEYVVYYSTQNNINGVSDMEVNGTKFGDFEANISSKTVTGLTQNSSYYFNTMVIDTAGNKVAYQSTNEQTMNYPTSQASNVNFTSVTKYSMQVNWSRGNGDGCLVFMKQGSNTLADPDDAVTYQADPTFGSGDQIASTGWYCVYRGTSSSVSVDGLDPATYYRSQVMEFNTGSNYYNTSTASNNPNDQMTTALVQAKDIVIQNTGESNCQFSWTRGNGDSCAVFMSQGTMTQGSNTLAQPVDNNVYIANSTFESGDQIESSGWYTVYRGTGTSETVSGLSYGTDYIIHVCEIYGNNQLYNRYSASNNPKAFTTTTCFIAGTKISMADGSVKNIEDIKPGDIVKSVDVESMAIVDRKVTEVFHNPPAKDLVKIYFNNGTVNINTKSHPYWVVDKAWSSVEPGVYIDQKDYNINRLEQGDRCMLFQDGKFQIVVVKEISSNNGLAMPTYNFHVENTSCYFANKVLVHNKP